MADKIFGFRENKDKVEILMVLNHSKSGTVHNLTGFGDAEGSVISVFKASANYVAGDTIKIDDTSYTIKLSNGENADDNLFVSGATVEIIVDTENKIVNFKAGGGLSDAKLAAANAAPGDVRTGKKFYAGDKEVKTGTLPVHNVSIGSYIDFWTNSSNGQKYIDINKIPEGIYESTGAEYSPQVRAPAELFGNAAASQVLAGVTFTSQNGAKIAGTMTNRPGHQESKTAFGNGTGSIIVPIPKGAYLDNGESRPDNYDNSQNSSIAFLAGTATPDKVLAGNRFCSAHGVNIAGTMPNRGAPNQTLGIGGSYSLSAGYYSGGKISAKGSFSGSGSSGDKSGSYSEIYRNESNVTREIQARSHASASINGKTVTITVHAEAYQRANDIPTLSGTKSSVDYSFSFTIS